VHLLKAIEILLDFLTRTYLPICFISHEQNIRSQLSNSDRLEQSLATFIEFTPVHHGIKGFDFLGLQPVISILKYNLSDPRRNSVLLNISADEE